MKLLDFICFDAVIPQLTACDRDGAIAELITALAGTGMIKREQEVIDSVIERENEASTGIGKGVAVPHIKHSAVDRVVAAIGCKSEGIDFSSLDKQLAYSVILLLSPVDNADNHLRAMESIFRCLQKDDFRKFLRQARTVEQIKDVITEQDGSGSI